MNLSQSLKEKNRISGRIAKLQREVIKYNQWREDKTNDFNSIELLGQLDEERAKLVELKTRISQANVGIAGKLVSLAESKGELTFWNSFVAGAEIEKLRERIWKDGAYVEIIVSGGYSITNKDIQQHINNLQKIIDDTQDEIDNYNATTKV